MKLEDNWQEQVAEDMARRLRSSANRLIWFIGNASKDMPHQHKTRWELGIGIRENSRFYFDFRSQTDGLVRGVILFEKSSSYEFSTQVRNGYGSIMISVAGMMREFRLTTTCDWLTYELVEEK